MFAPTSAGQPVLLQRGKMLRVDQFHAGIPQFAGDLAGSFNGPLLAACFETPGHDRLSNPPFAAGGSRRAFRRRGLR